MDNPDSAKNNASTEEAAACNDGAAKSELEMVLEENKRLNELAEGYLDTARRLKAEFENYQKRTAREKEEDAVRTKGKVISDMLPLLDDLERALEAQCSPDEFKDGISKIYKNMLATFKEYGLEEIPAEIFNPIYHEALAVGEGDENKILDVYQKGYALGSKVLRCSKVKVAKKSGENNG